MASGQHSAFGSFTTSCLDDIPFKIGTKFLPPQKVNNLLCALLEDEALPKLGPDRATSVPLTLKAPVMTAADDILLPPDLDLLKPSVSHALDAEYSFETEEAVLKWSEERERQIEEQRRYEEERQAALAQQAALEKQAKNTANSDELDSEAQNDGQGATVSQHSPDYENTKELYPHSATNEAQPDKQEQHTGAPFKPYFADVQVPNPLLANISNDILKPIPINQTNDSEPVKKIENSANTFDVSLFEQEDDPFDNLELQTIDVLEELKTVLEETNKTSLSPQLELDTDGANDTQLKEVFNKSDSRNDNSAQSNDVVKNIPLYENVEDLRMKDLKIQSENSEDKVKLDIDLTKLPPVPPRRDLVGRSMPLPPIGGFTANAMSNAVGNLADTGNPNVSHSWNGSENVMTQNDSSPKTVYDNVPVKSPNPFPKPPRHFKYSRHIDEVDTTTDCSSETGVVNIVPKSDNGGSLGVQFRNTKSNPDLHQTGNGGVSRPRPVPAPRRAKSPPSRASSGQLQNQYPYSASSDNVYAWNRYSPLPPPPTSNRSPSPGTSPAVAPRPVVPSPVSSSDDRAPVKTADDRLYDQLSNEAQATVDNLVSMGFPKPRVARAVQSLGSDEKEIVEHLCLVDQLTDKGHNVYLAETALLLFNNNSKKASSYLELFSQLTELGFSGEKIKEALVKTNIDREQTLDILTATS